MMPVQCFGCKQFGHMVKFCPGRKPSSAKTHTAKEAKSEKRRQRDYDRLVQFRDRKTVCASMPYYEVDDLEFRTSVPRCTTDRQQINSTALKQANINISALKEELETIKRHNSSLSSTIDELKIENKNLIQKVNTLSDNNNFLSGKLSEIVLEATTRHQEVYDATYEAATAEFEDIINENESLRIMVYTTTKQFEELRKRQDNDKEVINRWSPYCMARRERTTSTSESSTTPKQHITSSGRTVKAKRNEKRRDEPPGSRPCSRCGFFIDHKGNIKEDCPAFYKNCGYCGKRGHFTEVCKLKIR